MIAESGQPLFSAVQSHTFAATNFLSTMENKNYSFNDVPEILGVILTKLNELGVKVDAMGVSPQADQPVWFNISALIDYLPNHPAEQTVYGWTSARKIPFHKKGKNILFLKSEIDEWLHQGERMKSDRELEMEAEMFVRNKKRYGKESLR